MRLLGHFGKGLALESRICADLAELGVVQHGHALVGVVDALCLGGFGNGLERGLGLLGGLGLLLRLHLLVGTLQGLRSGGVGHQGLETVLQLGLGGCVLVVGQVAIAPLGAQFDLLGAQCGLVRLVVGGQAAVELGNKRGLGLFLCGGFGGRGLIGGWAVGRSFAFQVGVNVLGGGRGLGFDGVRLVSGQVLAAHQRQFVVCVLGVLGFHGDPSLRVVG